MAQGYLGEIRIMSFGFAPKNWAICNGQFLPIAQNQTLFGLLKTTYGGNGTTTFALPNLQGRMPVHIGNGIVLGEKGGETAHTLIASEMTAHNHQINADGNTAAASNSDTPAATSFLGQSVGVPSQGSSFAVSMYGTSAPTQTLAPATIGNSGGNQPHENMSPYLVLNFIIALQGIFPSQN